jgi:hypothetical protein
LLAQIGAVEIADQITDDNMLAQINSELAAFIESDIEPTQLA